MGLQKLLREVRINQETLSEEDISFMIAPRLNAASRMDNPMEAFKLLATTDEAEAEVLAEHLHNLNDNRKTSVAAIMREINAELHGSELGDVVVMGNPLWSPGVLGLLASRITEVYERPAFVWGRGDGEIIKGSSRSDGTVNIVDVMVNVRENFFLHVGGHEQAGGFSISFENVHTLEEELSRAFLKVKKLPVVENEGKVDCVLAMEKVNRATWGEVAQLAPFGVGNPKPLFLFEKAAPFLVKHFGKEKNHLELSFRTSEGRIVKAIGFFMGAHHFEKERGVIFAEGVPVDLTANIELSRFMGREEIRLRIIDVRPCM